jgi:plastocyanin
MAIQRHIRVSLVLALMVGGGIFLPRMVSTREQVRDVRIVARNMAFYLEGSAEPNPQLRLTPGEYVRVVFRNEDKGMQHDFVIPSWQVGTTVVEFSKEKSTTFRVPDSGEVSYACSPHSAMMSGKILLR